MRGKKGDAAKKKYLQEDEEQSGMMYTQMLFCTNLLFIQCPTGMFGMAHYLTTIFVVLIK